MPKVLALLAFGAIAGAPATLWAQARSVAVVDATSRPGAATAMLGAVDAQKGLIRVAPSAYSRALLGPLAEEPPPATEGLGEHLRAADDAIARFDFDRALIELFRAERPLIDSAPSDPIRRALADVNFRLGLVYLAQGDDDRARLSFGVVHSLVPGMELDPARYPPEVVGGFERARPGPDDSNLSISASTEKAEVFVDGHPRAPAPTEIAVPAGVHYVLVTAPGHRPAGRRVVTAPGGVEPVRIALGPLPPELLAARLRRRLADAKATEARVQAAGAEVLAATGADVAILLFDDGTGTRAVAVHQSGVLGRGRIPEGASDLAAVIAPTPLTLQPAQAPWYRRPWGIAAISGAVVATASVIAIVALSQGQDTRPTGGLCFRPPC